MLLIDDREPKRLRERVCAGLEDCDSRRMLVGDFLLFDRCGHTLAIERKRVDDLLSSIPHQKLKRQVSSLREFDSQILLIQGAWRLNPEGKIVIGLRESAWLASTVQMILLGLQRAFGVRMLWVATEEELILTIQALAKQGGKRCWLEGAE